MSPTVVEIDTRRITDWASFHDVFSEAFGFPPFYGRKMDAWVDCLTSLDKPEDGMTKVHASPGGVVVLDLVEAGDFASRLPDQYAAVIECSAFVNWRRLQVGEPAVLALSFFFRENNGRN